MPGRLHSGQKWRPKAAELNAFVDSSEDYQRRRQLSQGGNGSRLRTQTDIVKVKNTTGEARRKGEILEVFDVLAELTDEHIMFSGILPTGAESFGVLKRDVPNTQFVEMQMSGICIAKVNVTDIDHRWANYASQDPVLQSKANGPHELIYTPGELGEQDCVVRLGNEAGIDMVIRFEITDASLGTATVLVHSLPDGLSVEDLPAYGDLSPSAIEVCDPDLCFLNEPVGELLGRKGWARWMKPLTVNSCQPEVYDLEPHWEVFQLCCPDGDCV